MRIVFALPGLHRVDRGAEIAFIAIASELARLGNEVTLIGSGPPRNSTPYRYVQVPSIGRERFARWPSLPMFRNDTAWEDATFAASLLRAFRPKACDVTITCSYPWTNWALRRLGAPPHVYVTQNGDWPAYSNRGEFRLFGCDGLVCTNPDYFDRNRDRYRAALIPNGVDTTRFTPGPHQREKFGLPRSGRIVLMVSAFIASKNIPEAIRAMTCVPDATLVVAGDGPLRNEIARMAEDALPGRYRQLTASAEDMPALYRSADAFLHLSRDESFGNVFVEALACGIPVVAYDLPRTRWIVGEQGSLAPDNSAEALASMIERAMAGKAASSASLVARASLFDWASIAAKYQAFLEDVVQPGNASVPQTARAIDAEGMPAR